MVDATYASSQCGSFVSEKYFCQDLPQLSLSLSRLYSVGEPASTATVRMVQDLQLRPLPVDISLPGSMAGITSAPSAGSRIPATPMMSPS